MTASSLRRPANVLLLVIACGCAISLINNGPRTSMGFFLTPISSANGWGREVFSFSMALQNLAWGLGAFALGAAADKWGSWRVLCFGSLLYASGIALTAHATTPLLLNLTTGLMVGVGLAGCAFGIIMSCFGRIVEPHQRPMVFGIATAAASLGQFVFAPLTRVMIDGLGWQGALNALAGIICLIPILAIPLAGKATNQSRAEMQQTIGAALREALSHRSYLLLTAGFFVCGFQVAFINVHLPSYLNDIGIEAKWGPIAIMLIGLFNVVGSLASGYLGTRHSKRWILTGIYFGRSILYIAFILLPPSPVTVVVFSVTLGLLWLSTVAPTNSLVAIMFGTRYFAMLAGIVFFSHQIGSFLGVWLGGYLYDLNHSYMPVWWIAIGLGVIAGLLHMPIVERAVVRPSLQPAE